MITRILWIIIFIGITNFCTEGTQHELLSKLNFFKNANDSLLLFDPTELTIPLNTENFFNIRASRPLSIAANLTFRPPIDKNDKVIIELHKFSIIIPAGENGTEWIPVDFMAVAVGRAHKLEVNCTNVNTSDPCQLITDNNFRIAVIHSVPLLTVIQVVGWIYFVAWSISFYPQIILNFRRKSVLGLNFDFLGLNFTGFLFYSLYNCAMLWIPIVQEQYKIAAKDKDAVNPVQLNDVIFALHALFATSVTILQCFFYEKGQQHVSRICKGILSIIWLIALVSLIVVLANATTWLIFFNILSGIKLAITLIKYIPQAYFNYRRKSTAGWSIGNILLDMTGGVMSLLQMFLLAYNNDDWKELFEDFTKFGLGLISLLFDLLFICQHYIFYRNSISYEPQDSVLEEDDGQNQVGQTGVNSIHVPYVEAEERRGT